MIVVYSEHTESIEPIVSLTLPGKSLYAARHGYKLISAVMKQPYRSRDRFAYWLHAMEQLDAGDWLFAIEADALITNHNIKAGVLTDCDADMVFACDGWGFNAGTFLLQKNARSMRFLQNCMAYRGRAFIEQEIMACVMANENEFHEVQDMLACPARVGGWAMFPSEIPRAQQVYNRSSLKVRVATQRVMNAYPRQVYRLPIEVDEYMWQPGDLILHLPGVSNADRIALLQGFQDIVVK